MTFPLHAHEVSRDQVIAAIYETMIRPELCDCFTPVAAASSSVHKPAAAATGFSDSGFGRYQAPDQVLQADPDLQAHFARATDILEQQWVKSGRPTPLQFYEGSPRCWLVMQADGQVALASRAARQHLKITPGMLVSPTLDALDLDQDSQEKLHNLLREMQLSPGAKQRPLILNSGQDSYKILCRMVQSGHGRQASLCLILETLKFEWNTRTADMLSATFGLHQQEMQLVRRVLEGRNLAELSAATAVSETGLSAQWQTIQAKAGAPGLPELLRLFCFLMSESSSDQAISSGAVAPPQGVLKAPGVVDMHFFKIGADTGQPVIFLHGLLDGIAAVQRLQSQFRKRGFRVYAPLRCGYGQSGLPPSPQRIFDVLIDQLEALMEQENLQRPILLGHLGGSVFAHVAARRLRDRIAGVVAVSGMAPVDNLGHLAALRGHQRALAVAARHSPKMLPLAISNWARSVRRHGPGELLARQTLRGSDDRTLIDQLPLSNLLEACHGYTMQQGGAGLTADLYWMVRDWRRHVHGRVAPVIYLHGGQDPFNSAGRLRVFAAGRNDVQLRLCPGVGTMLLYARPELVFAALEELADR